jgi:hypothetical protein
MYETKVFSALESRNSIYRITYTVNPRLITWQVPLDLSRFALSTAFSASLYHEPSTHSMAERAARATHHLYIPIPLGVTEDVNETVA